MIHILPDIKNQKQLDQDNKVTHLEVKVVNQVITYSYLILAATDWFEQIVLPVNSIQVTVYYTSLCQSNTQTDVAFNGKHYYNQLHCKWPDLFIDLEWLHELDKIS